MFAAASQDAACAGLVTSAPHRLQTGGADRAEPLEGKPSHATDIRDDKV
jgi:hypothetical protein